MTNLSLLYIDDDELTLKLFGKIMSRDFDVSLSSTAKEAELIVANKTEHYDVIISDFNFENEKTTGTDLLKRFKEQDAKQLLVLCSAYREFSNVDDSPFLFIKKPIDYKGLTEIIINAFSS